MNQNDNRIFRKEDLDWKELETIGIHKEEPERCPWQCGSHVHGNGCLWLPVWVSAPVPVSCFPFRSPGRGHSWR